MSLECTGWVPTKGQFSACSPDDSTNAGKLRRASAEGGGALGGALCIKGKKGESIGDKYLAWVQRLVGGKEALMADATVEGMSEPEGTAGGSVDVNIEEAAVPTPLEEPEVGGVG